MNTTAVRTVMKEAHDCAMLMLETGTYIERELPHVYMDDATRKRATELCSKLIDTKHDIIHELFELDELIREGAAEDRMASFVDRIISWLSQDIQQMHRLVMTVELAAKSDPRWGSAYILVAESAVNILIPFNRAATAADGIRTRA